MTKCFVLTVAVDRIGDAVQAGGVAYDLLATVVVAAQCLLLGVSDAEAHRAFVLRWFGRRWRHDVSRRGSWNRNRKRSGRGSRRDHLGSGRRSRHGTGGAGAALTAPATDLTKAEVWRFQREKSQG